MKKLLALLLIAVICLPLVACSGDAQGTNSAKAKEYIGKWMLFGQDGYVVEILEDGLAKSSSPDETKDLRWYYNSQMDGIFLSGNGESPYFIQIATEMDCRYLLMNGNALYHENDQKFAENAEMKRVQKVIDNRFASFKTLKLGETYTLINGVTIQVHEFIREGDNLNVRKGAGTGYSVVAKYDKGTVVKILETKTVSGTTWGRTDKGWVSMDYVL